MGEDFWITIPQITNNSFCNNETRNKLSHPHMQTKDVDPIRVRKTFLIWRNLKAQAGGITVKQNIGFFSITLLRKNIV